ncbi:exonuclease SbcCD subunit D [Lacticaseibacillus nasuensis]|uniref:exonuclease SbcCD subunit D n=1 Tax=Lacticaseibacillus nasuensis TaxID=944671 RepID=UPI00224811A3|nr:exonuclease SbcCD subunit D [Lacticaseibacillus nasuensis]MCX2455713.1 exonuclease SbcCD subunit D [Lacticaseibacillus nasuensis]
MRFLHTADWHIGRTLAGFNLAEDQQAVFDRLVATAKAEQVDAIVIAGDLYDRALANEDAVTMVNAMLTKLNRELGYPVLAISGNHDSAVRLNTGREWFAGTQLYLNTQLAQAFTPVTLGDTQFFLLPYFEPIAARQYFNDDSLTNLNLAMPKVVAAMQELFDPAKRHVLVAHFFAAGSEHSDSETLVNVGGLDAVAVSDLAPFDYVALGHLHNRHALQATKVQYAGSLLKFSVSEANQEKGVYIVDTGTLTRKFVALAPRRELIHRTASYAELTAPDQPDRDAFTAVTLTDTEAIPNVMAALREVFPYLISLDRAHGVTGATATAKQVRHLSPQELLAQFYHDVTGAELTTEQQAWADAALAAAKEDD